MCPPVAPALSGAELTARLQEVEQRNRLQKLHMQRQVAMHPPQMQESPTLRLAPKAHYRGTVATDSLMAPARPFLRRAMRTSCRIR
ncbi:MAG: hypothetical protein R3E96_03185 [Planctomycetota bacterium]